ncbi:MAG: nucleotidyltransferase [Nitratireductor sp.]|nr:nucleotidyltransferase [Nitratireductor sp.]
MAIPEAQLETWSKTGAGVGSKETYAAVRTVLEHKDAPFKKRSPKVFLQGSYGNDTNIWAESDVDVVIRMDSVFYYDISSLPDYEQIEFKAAHPPAEYKLEDFKGEVTDWLQDWFGNDAQPENKAVEIAANNGRRKADVLISSMHRRYYNAGLMGRQTVEGVKFLARDGTWITNYPTLHSNNLTTRHQQTNGWLKPTIRIFKSMRRRLVDNELLSRGTAPSYFIEGMLYNVPLDRFGTNYVTTVTNRINYLWAADRSQFNCTNGQHKLLGDGTATSWPAANCTAYLRAVINLWNNW